MVPARQASNPQDIVLGLQRNRKQTFIEPLPSQRTLTPGKQRRSVSALQTSRGEGVVNNRIPRSTLAPSPGIKAAPPTRRPISMPAVGCMMLTTISFGAARIHAGAIFPTTERPPTAPGISTRVVDFKPNAISPAAFADWTE